MSLKHLPPEWRAHPVVVRAQLDDLTERVGVLEASAGATSSRPSKDDTRHRLDPVTLRLLILGLCILCAAGVIRPEALLKMLPIILRLTLGV